MYGAAYAQSPVWGVGNLPSAPLDVFMGEESATLAEPKQKPKATFLKSTVRVSLAFRNQSSSDSMNLLVELEKRGKTCPSSTEEKYKLILDAHHLGHFGREAIFKRL